MRQGLKASQYLQGPVIEGELLDETPPPDDADPKVRFAYYYRHVLADMRKLEEKNVTPK